MLLAKDSFRSKVFDIESPVLKILIDYLRLKPKDLFLCGFLIPFFSTDNYLKRKVGEFFF